ncbi:2-oxo acid dehydrogenase subunit E2 [Flammeovirga yaeyamensis]|uniref:Dihydrolipoamide acetyltransferase component of pyruvate dehydrogenase complex n=1 Tax=Flammeovirga yaeyamensis TaxID=367791 RepID=A0AAX1N4K2_9BACT|nr:2-oxo acid dehydrogenase subunit E2 [Flammeovirga yaeyamensis]MBB3698569.1 pyruvate dehydrogenase E2 component (dihydrolipoamide acetyltransferase) [Flammeovirga yaeyamensis]NMF34082.1 biotin/lipoyl-binding protein [Flammeovirga yaeyamensis]QWG01070.1 2-oxo acid dehydrogenase subunit E2 [Flammeovirga yaeyamensis]
MAEVIRMPKMSDTMTEGVIASWLVKVGDEISSGDIIAEVETDKATMELENYEDGVLLYIAVEEKQAVPVDGVIAIVGEEGEDYQSLLDGNTSAAPAESAPAPAAEEAPAPAAAPAAEAIDVSGINATVVKMPKMSDTMTDGTISQWLMKVGDEVNAGDILAEVQTDKATMELESYDEGKLLYVAVEDGGSVPVDGVIAIIGEEGADYETLLKAEEQKSAAPAEAAPAPAPKAEAPAAQPAAAPAQAPKAAPATAPAVAQSREAAPAPEHDGKRVFASPLAKKMAEDRGFNIAMIPGSGEHGRVIKRDVEAYVPSPTPVAAAAAPAAALPAGVESFDDQPMNSMRKAIARNLTSSQFGAPHFYLTMDIDMDKAMAARKSMNEIAEAKISFNDMVVKAVATSLKMHPLVNSLVEGDVIKVANHINVGVAVAIPDGLVVPVIRNTDMLSLSQISSTVKDMAGKAKDKKLGLDEMSGATFTISNLGMFGIEQFTSIINAPASCILAVGGIKQVPVVKNGQIVPGNIMKITLTCDHRSVDGAIGAAFLKTLKGLMEDPVRILI